MPLFLYRWPDGHFSVVSAPSRDDAIVDLDLDKLSEVNESRITRLPGGLFNFDLNQYGEIVFGGMGELTERTIRETCYPLLENVLADVEVDPVTRRPRPEHQSRVRRTVREEKKRCEIKLGSRRIP